jgi:hypothetical protein
MTKKNKITIRLDDVIFEAIEDRAFQCKCTPTKFTEQLIIKTIRKDKKTAENCLLEISINAAAAVQELAREILSESPEEYNRYNQAVLNRTKRGLHKFEKLINE